MPSIQLKRGAPAAVDAYTGPAGEIVADSQNWNLRLQDGINAGGVEVGSNLNAISAPEIISPLNGATGVSNQPILQTSAYAGSGTHVASRFRIASDAAFTGIVHDSGRVTSDLLSYSLAAAGVSLTLGGTFYAQASHESSDVGDSGYGPTVMFVVRQMGAGVVIDGDIVAGQFTDPETSVAYWLLAAPATKRAQRAWGLEGTDTSLYNSFQTSETDPKSGLGNTGVLTSATYSGVNDTKGSIGAPAARYCATELDKAYFLPNKQELWLVQANKAAIDGADLSGGANTLASIGAAYCWTSSENNGLGSFVVRMSDAATQANDKSAQSWVIPCRRIPV